MSDNPRLLTPLIEFYEENGIALPSAMEVRGSEIPEPYQTLLVHSADMTPTLERHHGERIHVKVLRRRYAKDILSRQVILVLDSNEKPVEFGAIRIYMDQLPVEAQTLVLEGCRPLGTILRECVVSHSSCPNVYLRATSDTLINRALGLPCEHKLYGRRNVIFSGSGEMLADIVEILPPA